MKGVYHGSGILQWRIQLEQHHQDQQHDVNSTMRIHHQQHVYEGEFSNGLFHGRGVHHVNGKLTLEGIWNKRKWVESLSSVQEYNQKKKKKQEKENNSESTTS
jgi:hypothetical protein